MNLFKLERKEYKKISKEFRNTYVGGKLYTIFDSFSGFAIFLFIAKNIYDIFFQTEELSTNEIRTILESIDSLLLFSILVICAVISYYVYFKYLTKYIENKENK